MIFKVFHNRQPVQKGSATYRLELSLPEGRQRLELKFMKMSRKTNPAKGMDGYTYCFNGRSYRDVASLRVKQVEKLAEDVQIFQDAYGEKTLRCYTNIPTFDSCDREWDSHQVEYLLFDGKDIHLVVLRGGYRIASLTFYHQLVGADPALKPLIQKLGWPIKKIQWKEV